MNVLELKKINVYYGNEKILNDFNLEVKKNEILCIMGPSGCGKSTLLSLINGFLEENNGRYSGEIFLNGENIKKFKKIDIRKKISTLFQDSIPFPLSIEKNILYSIEFYNNKIDNKDDVVKKYLQLVNLYEEIKDKLKKNASILSGGQKQRLCIARMLTTNPEILIFDEPCSSLDIKNSLIIENLIKKLSEKYTIIMTTHSEEQAKRIANRIINIGGKL